jgi:hypothetical protein
MRVFIYLSICANGTLVKKFRNHEDSQGKKKRSCDHVTKTKLACYD